MKFPRKLYWDGLPFSPPGDLPDLGIEIMSPESPVLADRFSTSEPLGGMARTSKNSLSTVIVALIKKLILKEEKGVAPLEAVG